MVCSLQGKVLFSEVLNLTILLHFPVACTFLQIEFPPSTPLYRGPLHQHSSWSLPCPGTLLCSEKSRLYFPSLQLLWEESTDLGANSSQTTRLLLHPRSFDHLWPVLPPGQDISQTDPLCCSVLIFFLTGSGHRAYHQAHRPYLCTNTSFFSRTGSHPISNQSKLPLTIY